MAVNIKYRVPRRIIQFLFFLLFIAIPYINTKEIYDLVGNFLAFNAFGVPLADPLSMIQATLGTLAFTQEMLIGAGLSLLLALIMGSIFCSWICPFGFLSELLHPVPNPEERTKKVSVSLRPFALRCFIVLLGLIAILTFAPFPILNQISMPGWISLFWQSVFIFKDLLWVGLIFPFLLLSIEFIVKKRIWCRYLCPQSVLISLAGLVLPKRFQVFFARKQCTCSVSDQICRKSCSLGLNPREQSLAQKAQCTNCGDCIDACRTRGQALSFGVFGVKDLDLSNE